jgi:hypothetical protein
MWMLLLALLRYIAAAAKRLSLAQNLSEGSGESHNSCTYSTTTDTCSSGQDAAVLALREAWGIATRRNR